MKQKVIVDLSRETDGNAVIKTDAVIKGMTDNDNFETPKISLVTMETDKADFITKAGKALHGSEADTLAKNEAREVLNSNYRIQGNYVNTTCDGDPTKGESSGFSLCKAKTIYNLPDLEARNGKDAGSIIVFSRANPKKLIARLIQISRTPQDAHSWTWGGVTRKQKKNITNLLVGVRYWIRVAVVVNEDIIDWSEPFSIIVT